MKYSFILSLAAVWCLLSLAGCGAAGDGIKISEIEPIHTNLLKTIDTSKAAVHKATLRKGTISSEGFPISQKDSRNIKIDTTCKRLENSLAQSNLFTSIEYQGKLIFLPQVKDSEILFVLDCNEKIIYDKMSSATSAGLSGFFTLGAAPPTLKYYYTSEMKLHAYTSTGQIKEYIASSSADVTFSSYMTDVSRRWQALDKARQQLSMNNIDYLVHQIIHDEDTYYK